ncbi:alpha-L RNA-binding motif-containing protein [Atractiella rhizophila]|nr:alpha-L RNA-binding motif-containing protein [Atractiella rhizophila]
MRKARAPYDLVACLPRMAWGPTNMYNILLRSHESERSLITNSKVFGKQWTARRLARGYHGDFIREGLFRTKFLPQSLPPLKAFPGEKVRKKVVNVNGKEVMIKDEIPIASLMFKEVERRLDVLIFRACLANSVYEARRMVIHGRVKLNGTTFRAPSHRLEPGDLFSVDPSVVPQLRGGKNAPQGRDTVGEDSDNMPGSSRGLPFRLPEFASPFLFVPPYLQVSFTTCSAVYFRHPTAKPGWSEIPTPYEADGLTLRMCWEYYCANGRRIREDRSKKHIRQGW